ncbi:Aste57867_1422 [Aphanomyces stellatus]|uniref:Aste57867_1422 protein n=1 Tax=Aphanomyces stellatus TaxID=120398 RepID=A0A485K7T5_9STRA|nr:hypothetical protein As57867_001421 [Aphanomyces stellatus]VFT78639.1 Aste57867_1422 [Aphanomyces stellatus]
MVRVIATIALLAVVGLASADTCSPSDMTDFAQKAGPCIMAAAGNLIGSDAYIKACSSTACTDYLAALKKCTTPGSNLQVPPAICNPAMAAAIGGAVSSSSATVAPTTAAPKSNAVATAISGVVASVAVAAAWM